MIKIIIFLPIFIAIAFPVKALADNWQQYEKIMDNYYALDKQDYKRITCMVSAPILDDSVKNIRQELAPFKGDFRIKDTVNQYSMYFDKSTGLHIDDPSFSIDILSEQGMKNPALVKQGISTITDGFNREVAGIDDEIKSIFESYTTSKKREVKIEKIGMRPEIRVLA
jgi:hypothetical protein